MNAAAKAELNSIKRELTSIISELESISYAVRHEFVGIGSEKCSDCIDSVINRYEYVKRQLDNMDTSKVREGFAQV